MAQSRVVRLYGRPGCLLCDEALRELRALANVFGFVIETVDIESDDALLGRYLFDIPVVVAGDVELGRAPIRRETLEDALRQHFAGSD